MKKLAALLVLALPMAACVVGADDPSGTGDGTGSGDGTGGGSGSGSGSGSGTSGTITENVTWSGTMDINTNTIIGAGVTVTVEAGTTITLGTNKSITVNGTLDAQGTKAAPVIIGPTVAGQFHYGLTIPTGGLVKLTYVKQTGGGIHTTGGTATIVDTYMSDANGDFLVMGGGAVDVQYSQLGKELGQTDSTHCDLHFDGTMPNTIKVTHSNISTTAYGVMFYKGTGADFTLNNWFGNETDVATNPGVTGDFSGSWFDGTPPPATANGANLTLTNLAAARLSDAGPR